MSSTVHEARAKAAGAALHALGPSPNQHRVLAVQCASAHHVADVYRTPGGLVYAARSWAHSHGDRDRHDAAHHGGHRDAQWVDWLGPGTGELVSDDLPAGCECGPRLLSRTRLQHAIDGGSHRLIVD